MTFWIFVIIGGLVVVVFGLAIVVAWLAKQVLTLRRQLAESQRLAEDQARDMAGLCAAGITQYRRQSGIEDRISKLERRSVENPARSGALIKPLDSAVEQARRGADTASLCADFGLAREEAALLVRMHGTSAREST